MVTPKKKEPPLHYRGFLAGAGIDRGHALQLGRTDEDSPPSAACIAHSDTLREPSGRRLQVSSSSIPLNSMSITCGVFSSKLLLSSPGAGNQGQREHHCFGNLLDSPDRQLEGTFPTCDTEVFVRQSVALAGSRSLKNLLPSVQYYMSPWTHSIRSGRVHL